MPLGLLRASDEREQFGKQPRDDPEVERQREADGWPRREQQLLDFAPDAFGRQIVERHGPAQLARVRVERRTRSARRTERRAARAGCRRQTSRGRRRAGCGVAGRPGRRTDRDTRPVSGSQPIALIREVAPPRGFFEGHVRIARDLEPAMSASGLRFAARQRDVDVAGLVDLKALADGFDAAQPLEQRAHAVGGQAEHLEIDVRRSPGPSAGRGPSRRRSARGRRPREPPRRWRGRGRTEMSVH